MVFLKRFPTCVKGMYSFLLVTASPKLIDSCRLIKKVHSELDISALMIVDTSPSNEIRL